MVEYDGSEKPYLVRAPNGKRWWYRRNAVAKLMPFGAAPPLSCVPAFRPSPVGSVEIRGTCVFCALPVLTDQGRTVRETTAGREYHHMVCCQWIGCCPQPGAVSAGYKKVTVRVPISGAQAPISLVGIPEMRGICEVCAAPVLTNQNRSARETQAGRMYHHMLCCRWTWLGCCTSLNQLADSRKKTVYIPILFSGSLPLASPSCRYTPVSITRPLTSVACSRRTPAHVHAHARTNAHARTCARTRASAHARTRARSTPPSTHTSLMPSPI